MKYSYKVVDEVRSMQLLGYLFCHYSYHKQKHPHINASLRLKTCEMSDVRWR